MKKKIKFLGLISAFVFIEVFAINMKSYATTEEPDNLYDIEACFYFLEDGSPAVGTRCITPSANGPCMRITNCMP
ncbi:hypothetical protein WG904_16080 [Pedobacter sp. Du54]|uniref:hypothetical protein n=1 Tax=Pedobacter anseongensis TaxID=3133439 RepID=UPI0030B2611D